MPYLQPYVDFYWSGRRATISQPPPWKGGTLPIELLPHLFIYLYYNIFDNKYQLIFNGGPVRSCTGVLPTLLIIIFYYHNLFLCLKSSIFLRAVDILSLPRLPTDSFISPQSILDIQIFEPQKLLWHSSFWPTYFN